MKWKRFPSPRRVWRATRGEERIHSVMDEFALQCGVAGDADYHALDLPADGRPRSTRSEVIATRSQAPRIACDRR
jgi:hypothetical protein